MSINEKLSREEKKKEKLNNKKIKDLKKGFSPKRWKDQIQMRNRNSTKTIRFFIG